MCVNVCVYEYAVHLPINSQSLTITQVVFFLAVSKTSIPSQAVAVALSVAQEASFSGDIVRADFRDSYHNLSLKMSAVLAWVSAHCRGARHVIKVCVCCQVLFSDVD